MALTAIAIALGAIAPACGKSESTIAPPVDAGVDFDAPPVPPIPEGTLPCEAPEYWPLELASTQHPIVVHYRSPDEEAVAAEVLEYLDTSWRVEVLELGFTPPLADDGLCGADGAFDVFLWRGKIESYVDAIAENPATAWDDWVSYMVLDPWGPYGGAILDSTVAHEFNHACQAADDWWDSPIVFEMTSTFIEDLVYDDDDQWYDQLVDFQSNADWAVDYDDGYATWYMYGSALYLHYLRERWFDGDATFVAEMWRRARNPAGTNEPDFEDALDDLLAPRGTTFLDSLIEFARWRWYTGGRDDGAHFAEGSAFGSGAEVPLAATIAVFPSSVDIDVMMLGTAYVEIQSAADVSVSLDSADPSVRWVAQAVPGRAPGGDGEVLDLTAGPATVSPVSGRRTLIVTAFPVSPAAADPDARTDDRHAVTIRVDP